jgi:hypothetical protein
MGRLRGELPDFHRQGRWPNLHASVIARAFSSMAIQRER